MALHQTLHQERSVFSASICCKHEYKVAPKLIFFVFNYSFRIRWLQDVPGTLYNLSYIPDAWK